MNQFCSFKELKDTIAPLHRLTFGFTGHTNVEKALGVKPVANDLSQYEDGLLDWFFAEFDEFFEALDVGNKEIVFISGMARGWDEIVALYAMQKKYELILAIPNRVSWHMNRWSKKRSQAIFYKKILEYEKSNAVEVRKNYKNHQFSNGFFARNQYIVDHSDILIAFKGYESPGTNDCIKRAKEKCVYNFFEKMTRREYGE